MVASWNINHEISSLIKGNIEADQHPFAANRVCHTMISMESSCSLWKYQAKRTTVIKDGQKEHRTVPLQIYDDQKGLDDDNREQ